MDILEARTMALEERIRKKTVFTGIVLNLIFDDEGEDILTLPMYNVSVAQAEILMRNQRRKEI